MLEETGWINATKTLPPTNTNILILNRDDGYEFAVGRYVNGNYYSPNGRKEFKNVSYWALCPVC